MKRTLLLLIPAALGLGILSPSLRVGDIKPGTAGQVAYSGSTSMLYGTIGGDLTGSMPSPSLKNTGTAGTYADASHSAQITTDAQGRVTAIASLLIGIDASQVLTGTIATARLGSGSASSLTFLRGDQSWAATPAAPTGSTNQTVYFSGTNVLSASSILTNNNSTLTATPSGTNPGLTINAATGASTNFALSVNTDTIAGGLFTNSTTPGATSGGAVVVASTANPTAKDQRLGMLAFYSAVSGTNTAGARIFASSEEAWPTNHGAYLSFATNNTGTTGTITNRMQLRGNGDTVLMASGSENAANATGPFVFIGTTNGVPSGTPTNSFTGTCPIIIDRADNRLYAWIGSAWVALTTTKDFNVDNSVTTSGANTATLSSPGLWRATRTLGQGLTLPAANSVAAGTTFKVYTASTGGATVNPAGTDTINLVNASTTVAASGHCKTFESDGVSDWAVTSSV